MLRESKVRLVRKDNGDWVSDVYVPGAEEHTDRKPPETDGDTDEIREFISGEKDGAVGSVNWVAGGMLVFLNTADGVYIPVGWRDEDAPSYSEMLCTASGIADTNEDVVNPRLVAYREALEEILLYDTSTDNWLLPEDDSIDASEESITNELHELWENRETDVVTEGTGVESVPATVRQIGSDRFTVYPPTGEMNETETTGHFVLDSKTRNVDLVDALVVDIPETSIEDLRIFDGEEIDIGLLDRDVFLFTPDEFSALFDGPATAKRAFTGGKFKTEDGVTGDFSDGREVQRSFDGVPTLTESHDELTEFLRELQDEQTHD